MSVLDETKALDKLFKKKKILQRNIEIYSKSPLPNSDEKVTKNKKALDDLNNVIDVLQNEINKSILSTDDLNKQKEEALRSAEEKKIDSDVINSLPEAIKDAIKALQDVKKNQLKDRKREILDGTLSAISDQQSTRQEGKDAAKAIKNSPGALSRAFVHFKNTALYKYKPKSKAAILKNTDALLTERAFWENRITMFKHKLVVFGDRKKAIKNANQNIEEIDNRIDANKALLLKKDDGIVAKIKNTAYKLSGAETKDSQQNLKNIRTNAVKKLKEIKKLEKVSESTINVSNNEPEKVSESSISTEPNTELNISNELEAKDRFLNDGVLAENTSGTGVPVETNITQTEDTAGINHVIENEDKRLNAAEKIENTKEQKKEGIQAVSTIFKKRINKAIKVSKTIVKQNDKIIHLLSKIEADSVIEQNIKIKPEERLLPEDDEIQKVSEIVPKKEGKSFLSKLIGMLELLFGADIMKFLKIFRGSNLLKILWKVLKIGGNTLEIFGKYLWKAILKSGDVFRNIKEFVDKRFEKFLSPIKNQFSKIIEKFKAPFNILKTKFEKFASNFKDPLTWLKEKWKSLEKLVGGLSKVKDSVKHKITKIKNVATDFWDGLKTKAAKKISNLKSIANDVKTKVVSAGDDFGDSVLKRASAIKTSAINAAKTVSTSASKYSSKALTQVEDGIGKAVKFGKGVVNKLKGKALDLAESKILPAMEKLLGKKAFKALTFALDEIPGVGLLTGLGFGIYDAMHGHYKKAALAVISGLISDVPGVGPALGLATSIAGGIAINQYDAHEKSNPKSSSKLSPKLEKLSSLLAKNREKLSAPNKSKTDDSYNNDVVTNKQPKSVERANLITEISNITVQKEQMLLQPKITQIPDPITNINTIHTTQETAGVNLSDAFPASYQ